MRGNYGFLLMAGMFILSICACDKREEGVQPDACFTVSSESIYAGESVTFTNCSADAISYLWEFGDNNSSVLQNPVHKYDDVGDFVVVLRASNKDLQDEEQLTIHVAELPQGEISVKTYSVSNITTNSARVRGSVVYEGSISAHGVCWNTSPSPIIGGMYTNEGTDLGDFTSELTGLDEDTKYYVRAYATNENGTFYGEERQFITDKSVEMPTINTLEITEITGSTALVGVNITDNGGGNVTQSGVCWNINQNPSLSDKHTTNGSSIGEFTSLITGLDWNTTYYVRAYATNSAGTAYGAEKMFVTTDEEVGVLIEVEPSVFSANDAITIYFNARHGDRGLVGYTGDVYAYSGLNTSSGEWQYRLADDWLENTEKAKLERIGTDYYKFEISPSVLEFYNCPESETVHKIAMVFRSENGELTGRNKDGSDIFIDVDRTSIYVPKTSTSPVIDGEIDVVWDNVSGKIINTNWPDQVVSYNKSATFKALWDDENIYVLIEVPDDDFYPSVESGEVSWLSDKPEVYLDVNETKVDGRGASVGEGHYQFAPSFNEGYIGCEWAYGIDSEEKNYTVEYAISIDSLIDIEGEVYNPNSRPKIGFDITLIDLDESGRGENIEVGRVNWVNDGLIDESWNTLDYSGDMIFVE